MAEIQTGISLRDKNTFRIGGTSQYYAEITNEEDIPQLLAFAKQKQIPTFVLGGGSNVLIDDGHLEVFTLRISTKGIETIDDGSTVLITAKAGENWDDVVHYAATHSYWGIENLSAIPGTVGGSIVQNIGAYGSEVSSVVNAVRVYNTETNSIEELSGGDCQFGYRMSLFKKHPELIVLSATFRLQRDPLPNLSYQDLRLWFCEKGNMLPGISEIRNAVISIRAKKFPDLSQIGTAGSFFMNPVVDKSLFEGLQLKYAGIPHWETFDGQVKLSAAYLIDKIAGLKGFRDGDAGVWKEQALVIVNHSKASSNDVSKLAQLIIKNVYESTNITLTPEVIHVK